LLSFYSLNLGSLILIPLTLVLIPGKL
jgi:hypothetical protein